MIVKLPSVKVEEGKKCRGPSLQPSERVSILLELADALRLNGELVGHGVAFAHGSGACWKARLLWEPNSLVLPLHLIHAVI